MSDTHEYDRVGNIVTYRNTNNDFDGATIPGIPPPNPNPSVDDEEQSRQIDNHRCYATTTQNNEKMGDPWTEEDPSAIDIFLILVGRQNRLKGLIVGEVQNMQRRRA